MAIIAENRKGKAMRVISVTLIVGLWMLLFTVTGLSFAAGTTYHLDRKYLSTGCASCHMGFDFSNGGGSYKCITCHGPASTRPRNLILQQIQTKDISKEFTKNYRHPVFDKNKLNIHSARETLPEREQSIPRHAECVDCHSPHYVSSDNPYAGLKGKKTGNFNAPITKEYELCYLCHAESANLPVKSTNKRVEFSINNPSFHPVEGEGKNLAVISLIRPYREKKIETNDISVIKCADCHGSENPNSPRGPHGSKYQGLLVDNFDTGDNVIENAFTYALCYRCHKRSSIMGNESFPQHSRHIAGERNFKGGGTSCHTCHTSHGSVENRYLIRFNRDYVTENSAGKLKFVEKGTYSFHGECWLSCHGVDHNPKIY